MTPNKKAEVRLKMEALSSADPDFKQIHDFFKRLADLNKDQYHTYLPVQDFGKARHL